MGVCWLIQGELKGVEANSGLDVSGSSSFVMLIMFTDRIGGPHTDQIAGPQWDGGSPW